MKVTQLRSCCESSPGTVWWPLEVTDGAAVSQPGDWCWVGAGWGAVRVRWTGVRGGRARHDSVTLVIHCVKACVCVCASVYINSLKSKYIASADRFISVLSRWCQWVHVCVCVAQGVTQLIYIWCNARGGNVEMSAVYLALGYVHCNTAVFQSTLPTVESEKCVLCYHKLRSCGRAGRAGSTAALLHLDWNLQHRMIKHHWYTGLKVQSSIKQNTLACMVLLVTHRARQSSQRVQQQPVHPRQSWEMARGHKMLLDIK